MKRLLLISFFFFTGIVFSQKNIGFRFQQVHSGNNLSLIFAFNAFKHLQIEAGLLGNISAEKNSYSSNIFKHKLYPTKWYEFLGLDAGLTYDLPLSSLKSQTYLFYNLQGKFAPISQREDWGLSTSSPYFWFQQTLGAGMDFDISERFYLSLRAGAGLDIVKNSKKDSMLNGTKQLTSYFCLGLKYSLE